MITIDILNTILFLSLVFTITTFFISLINYLFSQTLKNSVDACSYNPLVSILIPMRNEEMNISRLLDSIYNQTYKHIEIIVLDDNSNDNSYEIASGYANKIPNFKVIKGDELPKDWLGKNWACHQLSLQAKGELLLFVDADVEFKPNALTSLLILMVKYKLNALSVFPTQIFSSLGEKLVVPLMNWILISFLPLILVRKSKFKSLVAANGQVLLFHRNTYSQIGGHQSVKDQPVEDMELARKIKNLKMRIGTFLGGELIFCRMYDGFRSSIDGFSKNFYKGFKLHWIVFLPFVFLVSLTNISPFFLMFWNSYFVLPAILILLNRIYVSTLSRQSVIENLLLHIPQFAVFLFVGFLSVYRTKSKKNKWKGRQI